jgi:O-antigen ligase
MRRLGYQLGIAFLQVNGQPLQGAQSGGPRNRAAQDGAVAHDRACGTVAIVPQQWGAGHGRGTTIGSARPPDNWNQGRGRATFRVLPLLVGFRMVPRTSKAVRRLARGRAPLVETQALQGAAGVRPSSPLPWDLLLVAAAALILISAARLHSFLPGVGALRPALLVTVLAIPALLASQRGARHIRHLRSPLGVAMGFMFLWAVVGAPFALWPGRSVQTLTDSFLRTGMVVLIIASAVRNVVDVERLLKVYALGAIAFSLLGTGAGFRAFGGGGYDPNDAALFVVSALPLVVFFAVRAPSLPGKLLFGFGAAACISAIALSGSRGGYLALLAVAGFILLGFKGVRPWMRGAVVAGLAGALALGATEDFWDRFGSITDPDDYNRHSYGGRMEIWKRGVVYMAGSPLLGHGINNFSTAEARQPFVVASIQQGQGMKYSAAHSIWVQAGADLGVPGLAALVFMFAYAGRMLWGLERSAGQRRARGDPDMARLSVLGRPLVGALIGVAVAGSFLSHAYMATLWLPFAMALAVQKVLILRLRQSRV